MFQDCTSLVHCCWTSALWRRFLDESANRERTDFAIKEEEFRLREPGLRPVVKELEWMESPLENVNVLRSMDAGEILAAKLPPLPSTPVSGGVYLFNERFFLVRLFRERKVSRVQVLLFFPRCPEREMIGLETWRPSSSWSETERGPWSGGGVLWEPRPTTICSGPPRRRRWRTET